MKYTTCLLFACLCLLTSCTKKKSPGIVSDDLVVSTLAGSNQYGFANGSGAMAKFYYVFGIIVDSKDDIYVSDEFNQSIRKITSGGIVTTMAGNGTPGMNNNTGTAATFNYPKALAIDASDDIFIADERNHCVRKITNAAVVTTLCGGPAQGYVDGTNSLAKFKFPYGITIDKANNIYVADAANFSIRKITAAGQVTTIAGTNTKGYADGPALEAKFSYPTGIASDKSGNLYVVDRLNNCIRMISSAGIVSTLAGSPEAGYADGKGSAAKFNHPTGLTIDASGNILVADTDNHCIRKITPSGVVTTIAGRPKAGYEDGTANYAKFSGPTGVAVDSKGTIYVADYNNHCIRKISPK